MSEKTQPVVLALIPARGGSKGVPRKNIRPLNGKPLVAYSIEAALALPSLLYRVIVSTDDAEIAAVAKQYGVEVPFLRPAEISADSTPMLPVMQHAVRFVEQQDGLRLDWVLLLQPVSPLRLPLDIENTLRIARETDCDSVISVVQVFSVHPITMKRIENGRLLPYCIEEIEGTRRQNYSPPAYMRNGAIYLTRRDVLMNDNSIWGRSICPYVMPEERSINIDSELDFKLVELVMAEQSGTS